MRLNLNPTAAEIIAACESAGVKARARTEGEDGGRMDTRVIDYLGRRSKAFAEATSREPGKAMTYGQIKKEASRAAR